jgi:hypothetical protein
MKKLLPILLLSCLFFGDLFAGPGDTITVQTLTFNDITKRRGLWTFPDTSHTFRKVLMYQTLKCDPATTQDQYACGEWDYVYYNYIYDHTGVLDSNLITIPKFKVDGSSPDTFAYSYLPSYSYSKDWQYHIVYNSVISEDTFSVGSGNIQLNHTLQSSLSTAHSQYLWKQSELIAAGLTAGSIDKLQLDLTSLGSDLNYFKIEIAHTTLNQLAVDSFETSLQTVYEYNTSFSTSGINEINFTNPFIWDGVSNIVIQFSYRNAGNGSDNVVLGDTTAFNSGIHSAQVDGFLSFNGPDYVEVPVNQIATLDSFITISFWQFGDPNLQPQSDYCFEAGDANNKRVLCTHLPWSNSNIYWDAGNDGGSYDRISKAAPSTNYFKGQWNHWAFTKNVHTGVMKIFINGHQWHTGSGKTRDFSGITNFKIGANRNAGGNYDGYINEFRVWNVDLNSSTIKAWMNKDIDPSHPNYSNLVAYYKFDEASGLVATDHSSYGNDASIFGLPDRLTFTGSDNVRNLVLTNERPNIALVQGSYNSTIDSVMILDSLMNTPLSIFVFNDSTIAPIATDTLLVWNIGYTYIYENGVAVDSIYVPATDSLFNASVSYYSAPFEVIERYEISRFITPYGINLDLGPDGFTWIYDITDYAHLLHDTVDFQGGSQSELIDCKFVMIEGTPARELVRMDKIWGNNRDHLYKNLADDTDMYAKDIEKHPQAGTFQVKTRITGHGHNSTSGNYPHCCEWKDNEHFLYVDNALVDSWHIWKTDDCALNPVYPQGGTWPGAREGWCPGDVVHDVNYEVTSFVTGDSITVDYDITDVPANDPGMGNGRYLMAMHLMQYTAANFALDAEVYDVLTPNDWEYYSRKNPMCSDPKIVIRNSGSTALTSLTITYGVSGGTNKVYTWNGNLGFMQKEIVSLPVDDGVFWVGDGSNKFTVTVSQPNGSTDQNSLNDSYTTSFTLPDVYTENFIVYLRTNNNSADNSYTITDIDGNVVYSKDGLLPNRTYFDTLKLGPGCYELKLLDSNNDGLYYWAYTAQGSGSLKIKEDGGFFLKSFESEFGHSITYAFTIGSITTVESDPSITEINVFPNPSDGLFTIDIVGMHNETTIEVFSAVGELISSESYQINGVLTQQLDLNNQADGIYLIKITNNNETIIKKVIKN